MGVALLGARAVLVAVFLVAGLAKLFDRAGSEEVAEGFGFSSELAKPLMAVLPVVELAIAILLIPNATAPWAALAAVGLLGAFIVGILATLARGKKPDCRCFGQLQSKPIGAPTVVRNVALAALAAFVAWGGFDEDARFSVSDVVATVAPAGWVTLTAAAVLLLLLVLGRWLLLNVISQQGRLLVRIEALENAMRQAGGVPSGGVPTVGGPGPGLPVGAPAPEFSLPGVFGETLTLDALTAGGVPTLLIFTDPNCGPCAALMPEIAQWQNEYAGELNIALISRGDRAENRAKAVEHRVHNVLLQNDYEVAEAYQFAGTPSAVVVDAEGKVGSSVVTGADPIRALIDRTVNAVPVALGSPGGSNGQAAGAGVAPPVQGADAIGKPAPALSLPDLEGNTIDLADFQGEETVVLFWNPGCGFCQQMLPDLKSWEAKPPAGAPKLLVVSSGSADENRALGLRSPLLLDAEFRAGQAFQAGGTPMAVAVDAEGKIASGVAAGAQQVWALVEERAKAPKKNSRSKGKGR